MSPLTELLRDYQYGYKQATHNLPIENDVYMPDQMIAIKLGYKDAQEKTNIKNLKEIQNEVELAKKDEFPVWKTLNISELELCLQEFNIPMTAKRSYTCSEFEFMYNEASLQSNGLEFFIQMNTIGKFPLIKGGINVQATFEKLLLAA